MNVEQQLEDLRRRVAALENAAVKGKPAPALSSQLDGGYFREDDQVCITYGASLPPDSRMPSDDEMSQLMTIVFRGYPMLAPADCRAEDVRRNHHFQEKGWKPQEVDDHHQYLVRVRYAFRWLLGVKRTDIDLTKTLGYWESPALANWLTSNNIIAEIGGGAILVACIAAGDVGFLDPTKYFPNMMHLGLVARGEHGRPCDPRAWRRVLTSGTAPAPSSLEPPQYDTGNVTVRIA